MTILRTELSEACKWWNTLANQEKVSMYRTMMPWLYDGSEGIYSESYFVLHSDIIVAAYQCFN